MTKELADSLNQWRGWLQLVLAAGAIMGAFIYAGQRAERDEQQTRSLDRMATEMHTMREQGAEGTAQIRVLTERVRGLEDRMTRLERK